MLTTLLVLTLVACGRPAGGAGQEKTTAGATASPPTKRQAIIFLGDSLTAGRGLALADSMPAMIQKRVDAARLPYRVINAGRSGDTTAGGLARMGWYLRPAVRPRVLVIGLGSNDAMRGQSIAAMRTNLRAIIRRARAFDAHMKILLFQMHTFPNMGRAYAGAYNRMFAQIARAEHVVLLPFPLRGIAGVPALNQSDGIHPNRAGTRRFARNVWQALRPHL